MELEALIDAFNKRSPVVLRRYGGLEPPLHFNHITAIIPAFDHRGQPDYTVEVVDSVGRPVTCRARDLEVANEAV
jgi:hypothetical protein